MVENLVNYIQWNLYKADAIDAWKGVRCIEIPPENEYYREFNGK